MPVCHVDNGVHSSGIVPGRMDAIFLAINQEHDHG